MLTLKLSDLSREYKASALYKNIDLDEETITVKY